MEEFFKMIGLDIIREQIATNKNIEEVYRKINHILELIRKTIGKLEKKKKEEI